MRRALPLLLFLPLLTGCSWMAEVLLINNSKEPVVVRYSYRDPGCPDCEFHPKAYTIERWNQDSVPFLGDTIAIVWRMESDSTWYVELPAGKALVLSEAVNLDLNNDEQAKSALGRITGLEVISPNDATVSCAGEGCFPKLTRFSRARAGIIIE